MQNPTKKKVLILCTGNSCRSQMAEGVTRHFYSATHEVESAGTHPSYVNPHAITVLKEIGIDISNHRSKSVNEFYNDHFDYMITVCTDADRNCPTFPGIAKRIHWEFNDPFKSQGNHDDILDQFRVVRDTIIEKFKADWIKTLV